MKTLDKYLVTARKHIVGGMRLTALYGKGAELTITAQSDHIAGNAHPHFSVTANVTTPANRRRNDIEAGGRLHEEAEEFWPECAPIVKLHLSNADDGEPMHAEANGWYWLVPALGDGAVGVERYHGGNSMQNFPKPGGKKWETEYRFPTPDESLAIFAERVRITNEEAHALVERIKRGAYEEEHISLREAWRRECDAMRPRWQREAEEGIALLRKLRCE